jgi:RNA methyltransferase, TrmH family
MEIGFERMTESRIIAGSKDPVLTRYAELATAAGRARHGQVLLEGRLLVERAVADRLALHSILYTPSLAKEPGGNELLEKAREAKVPCYQATEGLIAKVTTSRPPPNVLAALSARLQDAERFPRQPDTVLLVAEDINNPDNLGMVLRTADAAGASAVLCVGEKTDPFHKNCVRAARGGVGRMTLLGCRDVVAYLQSLASSGVTVVGAALTGEAELFRCKLAPPIVVIVGNEQSGIRPETLDACTLRVRIPMAPGQDSLNVGVAAGVMLYEVWRQRTL